MHNACGSVKPFRAQCMERRASFLAMSMDDELRTQGRRLREARIAAGFDSATAAAESLGVHVETYIQHENGTRGYKGRAANYAKRYKTSPEWLLWGRNSPRSDGLVPIVGYVGADSDGQIHYAVGQDTGDRAPLPPAGTETSVALEVRGHSMKGLADDGALIYFETQYTKATRDMLGQFVAVQTRDGRVLIKRLLKGSGPHRYDLESIVGPTLEDVELEWVALVTAIVPPAQARKIIVRSGTSAAA